MVVQHALIQGNPISSSKLLTLARSALNGAAEFGSSSSTLISISHRMAGWGVQLGQNLNFGGENTLRGNRPTMSAAICLAIALGSR
jgi:hypothetical protein